MDFESICALRRLLKFSIFCVKCALGIVSYKIDHMEYKFDFPSIFGVYSFFFLFLKE